MKKAKKNIVYSTNPDFNFEFEEDQEVKNIPSKKQNLKIFPDRKNRAGKTVTVISGYLGSNDELKSLEKELKSLCGCGGSVKDGDILLQGNVIQKVKDHLEKKEFKVKISGI